MAADAAVEPHPGLHEGDPMVLDFKTPDRSEERPWQSMAIDGHTVLVRQPKNAFWLRISEGLLNGDDGAQVAAMGEFLSKVFDDESREHVQARLDDDDDDFDVDDMGDIVQKLQEVWGKGRGGSASGSGSSSRKRTTRSTARRR